MMSLITVVIIGELVALIGVLLSKRRYCVEEISMQYRFFCVKIH